MSAIIDSDDKRAALLTTSEAYSPIVRSILHGIGHEVKHDSLHFLHVNRHREVFGHRDVGSNPDAAFAGHSDKRADPISHERSRMHLGKIYI